MRNRMTGILVTCAIMLFFNIMPAPEGLPVEGWRILGVLFSTIVLWLTNAFPRYIVTLFIIAAVVLTGCYESMNAALMQFMTNASIMVIGSFLLASMLSKTSIPLRAVGRFVRITKDSGKLFMLVIFVVTTLLSSVCDDITALTIMYAFVVSLFGIERGIVTTENRELKAGLMIGLPVAAYAGGLITPVGAPSNVICIDMLRNATGIDLNFTQWFIIMLPTAFIIIIALWVFLCITLKPGKIDPETYTSLLQATSLGKWTSQEKKAVVILISMLTLWFSSTFFSFLTSSLVICIFACIMFMPHVNVVTHDDFMKHSSWDLFFLMPGVMIMAHVCQKSGLIEWLMQFVYGPLSGMSPFIAILFASFSIMFLRIAIPAGPPVAILSIPALIGVASVLGINPVVMMSVGTIWGTLAFLLPIDILRAYTYDLGQFSIKEMWKAELPTILVVLALVSMYLPVVINLVVPL